uniref:Uncharacterized protein n=1 Tax=Panagrolaimus sp. ES5 TaxID=591445 RepID=A0AC34G6Y0_9BILA
MGNQSSTGKCSSKEEYKTSTSSSSTENPTFGNGTAINKFYLEIVEELNKKRAEVDDLKLENSKMKGLCERIDHPAIDKYETEMLQLQKAHAEKEEMFQAAISRLNDAITSLKATVADSVITIQKLQAECSKFQDWIKKLKEEKSKLVDPNRLCVLDDIVDYGNIDYENLTEKINFIG